MEFLFFTFEFQVWRIRLDRVLEYIEFFLAVEEVDLSQDICQWENLTHNEKHFISHVLAFFAAADGIVLENLALRFFKEIQIPEVFLFPSSNIRVMRYPDDLSTRISRFKNQFCQPL